MWRNKYTLLRQKLPMILYTHRTLETPQSFQPSYHLRVRYRYAPTRLGFTAYHLEAVRHRTTMLLAHTNALDRTDHELMKSHDDNDVTLALITFLSGYKTLFPVIAPRRTILSLY